MKRLGIILFIILLSSGFSKIYCQDYNSEYKRIFALPNDTIKINHIARFYDKYFTTNFDSLKKGLEIILEAYHLSLKLNDRHSLISSSYRVGLSLRNLQSFNQAIHFFFICIKYSEMEKDYNHYYHSLMHIGLIYFQQRKWNDALGYFNKVTLMKNYIPEEFHLLMTSIYLQGVCNIELKNFAKAINLLNKAQTMAKNINDSDKINECFLNFGRAYSGLKQYNEALKTFNIVLKYYTYRKEKVALAIIYEQLAQLYKNENKTSLAIETAETAYHIAKSDFNSINLAEITDLLQSLYSKQGKYNMAYKYLLENNNIRDSIALNDISTQIALAQSKNEFEKREDKFNAELKGQDRKKNQAFLLAAVAVAFLIGAGIALGIVRKERGKSDKLLLNILPFETAQELKKFGRAIPRKHESVTIMFCDVKQFTVISEKLSPETLVSMLDVYISKFDEIISKHGLEKIKTIGDAYMCAGGLHSEFDDHPEKTVSAAIDILDFVKEIELSMNQKYGHSFIFRIGIHTGPVVSGIVGFHKYAYDIWGDTVNIAARMEEQSEPGEINVSGVTYSHIFNIFDARYRGMIEAKNKGPMEMYFINLA